MAIEQSTRSIQDLSIDEMVALRRKLTKKITHKRLAKNLFVETRIPAEWEDSFNEAKEWAFEKGLANKNSKWAFAKFCISNGIRMCLEAKDKEETPDVATATEYQPAQLSDGYHEEPNIIVEEIVPEDDDIITTDDEVVEEEDDEEKEIEED